MRWVRALSVPSPILFPVPSGICRAGHVPSVSAQYASWLCPRGRSLAINAITTTNASLALVVLVLAVSADLVCQWRKLTFEANVRGRAGLPI